LEIANFTRDDWRLATTKKAWDNSIEFHVEDVLGEIPSYILIDAVSRENSLVIYDGDDHKKEIQTCIFVLDIYNWMIIIDAPYQKEGSVFMSHDFGDRILTDWIKEDLVSNNFHEIFKELSEHLSTHMKAFKKGSMNTE
jgi:hypothetical protein